MIISYPVTCSYNKTYIRSITMDDIDFAKGSDKERLRRFVDGERSNSKPKSDSQETPPWSAPTSPLNNKIGSPAGISNKNSVRILPIVTGSLEDEHHGAKSMESSSHEGERFSPAKQRSRSSSPSVAYGSPTRNHRAFSEDVNSPPRRRSICSDDGYDYLLPIVSGIVNKLIT